MELKTTEQRYREFLDTLPLSTLRILGRQSGVAHASSNNKSVLVDELIGIFTGKLQPVPRSNRGAPVKQTYIDPSIFEKLEQIKLLGKTDEQEREAIFEVASGITEPAPFDSPVYTGILEITQGGYGFLRAHNCQPSSTGEDIFIPAPLIHALKLREGDFVACTAKLRQKNDSAAISELLSVNGLPIGKYESRPQFDVLTATYPTEKITLSDQYPDPALRILDLFVPVGKGQRALIIAPPKAGKTTLLKKIASEISENHRDMATIVLLIDERPEEVTDFTESVKGAQVISSTFDEGAEHHLRAARLALEHAKRVAELGKDVVILLDSLTKLTRACNFLTDNSGKTLSGGLDAAAFAEPKRFFGTARNTKEAGSITILATVLVETGSRMDDIIYEEFKGTGNCDIVLSSELAERRIFPAIDIRRSGTRREELLLSEGELIASRSLRERGISTAAILDVMKHFDNAQLIARQSDLIKESKR